MLTVALDRNTFQLELHRGHGRAVLHVQQHGLAGLEDIVLDACLHLRTYDAQCEDSRAQWLFNLLKEQPEQIQIRAVLLDELQRYLADLDTEDEDGDESIDLAQCIELAGNFARAGDQALAEMIRRIAQAKPFDWDWLTPRWEWVRLDGLPALISLAREAGQWLRQHPDEHSQWPFLESLLEESQLETTGHDVLKQLAVNDADIAAFVDFDEQARQPATSGESYSERFRQQWPLSRIVHAAEQHEGRFASFYMRFGRHATGEELQQIWQRLLHEQDLEICLRLLWVFRRTAMPDLHPRLLSWLDSEQPALREATIEALAQMSHPLLAQQTQQRLQAKPADFALLPLLQRNGTLLTSAELTQIAQQLPTDNDADTLHAIGSDLLDIVQQPSALALEHFSNWVYEHTPCSLCRASAVRRLHEHGLLSALQLTECRFDADEGTRKLADTPTRYSTKNN